jgi:hypothetical protein
MSPTFDTRGIVARIQGREGWWREAKRQLERQRWEDPDEISPRGVNGCFLRRSGWWAILTP